MAETPTRPTSAPWIDVTAGPNMRDTYSQPIAIAQLGKANLIAGAFGDVAGGAETAKANAALIVAACNACQLVNPDDPQSVANALDTIIASADVVLKGFGAHAFVRDTSGDHNSDWAIKLMPYITALARLEVALNQILPSRAALASIETQETR